MIVIWNTAEVAVYQTLIPMYYRNAQIVILVFDLTNQQTFENISYWIDQLKNTCSDFPVIHVCGIYLILSIKGLLNMINENLLLPITKFNILNKFFNKNGIG
jgi:hypothetical protein